MTTQKYIRRRLLDPGSRSLRSLGRDDSQRVDEEGNAAMWSLGVMLVTLAALSITTTASADPIEDFYKGKTINWILSAGAGGGYSSYAHVFAPYLSAHIPGKPNIVVQNMPGAG